MLTAFVVALVLAPAADVPVICPEQARAYVGHDVEVQGQVDEVGVSEDGKTLFLNFCGRYPGHLFNAVIFNLQAFPGARSLEGKTIKVRGKIGLYQDIRWLGSPAKGEGKPEIILERPEQVTIDSPLSLGAMSGRTEAAPGAVGSGFGGTDITPVRGYDSPPRPNKIIHPLYSTEAFLKKAEGTVMVETLIDSQGRVARARVIQSVPPLDKVALECVYQWTFHPAMKDGHPVPAIVNAPLIFRLPQFPAIAQQREQMGTEVPLIPPEQSGTGTGPVMDYDSAPRPVKITRPLYPQEAFAKRIEGTVVVEILIDSQGRVARARVIQSVPPLDAAALECAYTWTFEPAVKDGRPVPTIAHAPVAFRIGP